MNVGILIDNMSPSQLLFFIGNNARRATVDHGIDVTLFVNDIIKPMNSFLMGKMPIVAAANFQGLLIATSIEMARYCHGLNNNSTKVFYVNDLEWYTHDMIYYDYNITAFQNHLVARSAAHAVEIKKYAGKEVDLIDPVFNIERMCDEFTK